MKDYVVVRAPSVLSMCYSFFFVRYVSTAPRPVAFKVIDAGRTAVMYVYIESLAMVGLSGEAMMFSGYVFPGWGKVLPPSAGLDLRSARRVTGSFLSATRFGSLKMEVRRLEAETEENLLVN